MTRLAIAFFFLCATSPAMAFTGKRSPTRTRNALSATTTRRQTCGRTSSETFITATPFASSIKHVRSSPAVGRSGAYGISFSSQAKAAVSIRRTAGFTTNWCGVTNARPHYCRRSRQGH